MDVSCIGYLLAQILKFFLSGLSDGLLLCTLEHLVSAAVMPGLHHHGHGHFTCLCKVPQLPFEVPFINNGFMDNGKVCLRHCGILGGKNW